MIIIAYEYYCTRGITSMSLTLEYSNLFFVKLHVIPCRNTVLGKLFHNPKAHDMKVKENLSIVTMRSDLRV